MSYIRKNSEARRKLQKVVNGRCTNELHCYSLEKYGLKEEEIVDKFSEYISKFGLSKVNGTKGDIEKQ